MSSLRLEGSAWSRLEWPPLYVVGWVGVTRAPNNT